MPKPILLNDLLHLSDEDIKRGKVRFCAHNSEGSQLDVYFSDPDGVNHHALFNRTKQSFFKVGMLAMCLLKLSEESWLLTTIKEVKKDLGIYGGTAYEGEELEKYNAYYERVVVKYRKTHQAMHRHLIQIIDKLEVEQIYPNKFDEIDFPGYDRVRLSFEQLSTIITRRKQDWIAALENQKAVYLITDMNSGKQYVGSAYGGNGMLLQRWSNYVSNGHGGNKLLKDTVNEYGMEYVAQNFQYSILENYNARVDERIILERESWWKETLGSRAFGLNAN